MSTYDFPLLLKNFLEHGVAWAPEQEIIYRDKVRHTYRQTYERVLRLVAALQQLGCVKGTKIGVIERDSHRYLEMYFGIPGIGAILHTINPALAPDDLLYTMVHAEDEILIFHEDFLPLVERLRPRLPSIRKYILLTDREDVPSSKDYDVEYEKLLASTYPLSELPDFDENTQATLAYTTGTTGKPKGMGFSHRQLVLHTLSSLVPMCGLGNYGGLSKHEVYMPLTPLFHVHAWGIPYFTTMMGFKQVYPGKYEPDMILHLLDTEKVTFSHCVPTILRMVISAPQAAQIDLSQWKLLIGGSRLPKSLALQARALDVKLTAGYGMSESCPVLTIAQLKPDMEAEWDDDQQLDWTIKTGFPMPFVKLRILNAEGKDVARNGMESGEIVVRSPWLTAEYYKDPDRTSELWADGWMHTGDVANVDQYGYVQIVDRIKDVIKSGGEWIASLELENLLGLHAHVSEVSVIPVPDDTWGERPLAVIVPEDGQAAAITTEAMQAHLQQYVEQGVITKWAIPEYYVIIDQLPKTSVGKIDKKALRSMYPQAPGA